MVTIDHCDEHGWSTPSMVPFENLSIHPFNSTLHYSFSCFEGLKAYRDKNGKVRLFRPEMNVKRFLKSCQFLHLPSFCEEEFMSILKTYILQEKDWIASD